MPSIPFARFAAEVLELYATKAQATRCKMRQVLNEFGRLVGQTREITPLAVARWIQAHPGRKPATQDSLLRSFRAAARYGLACGYLNRDPFAARVRYVDWSLDDAPPPLRHHPREAVGRVLAFLRGRAGESWRDERLYVLGLLVAYTGLRKGEALHLAVADIDLDRGLLAVSRKPGWRPKTRQSVRTVGIPADLVEALRAWLPRTESPWLFPGITRVGPWTGGPPGAKALDQLRESAKRIGIEGFTFQSLRHSWATHAELWGLGETQIQRQLGHSSRRTQRHYRHADIEGLHAIAGRVNYSATA